MTKLTQLISALPILLFVVAGLSLANAQEGGFVEEQKRRDPHAGSAENGFGNQETQGSTYQMPGNSLLLKSGADTGRGADAGADAGANNEESNSSNTSSDCDSSQQSCVDYQDGCDSDTQSCEQASGKTLPNGAETGADDVTEEEAAEKNRRTKESFTGVEARGDIDFEAGQEAINAKRTQAITPTPEGAGTGAVIVTEAEARSRANEIRKNFVDPEGAQIQRELDLEEGQRRLDAINGQKVNVK